jgi:hypothetical protein
MNAGDGPGDATPGPATGNERGPARLAAEIRRIHRLLTSSGNLNHPKVVAELAELFKHVVEELDHRRGRHRASGEADAVPESTPDEPPADPEPAPAASGVDLKPNPLTATTSAEFMTTLRSYRQWSGDPSLREMAGHARSRISHSTISTALKGDRLPKLKVVLAIVTGCGGDSTDEQAFTLAWRKIRSGR